MFTVANTSPSTHPSANMFAPTPILNRTPIVGLE